MNRRLVVLCACFVLLPAVSWAQSAPVRAKVVITGPGGIQGTLHLRERITSDPAQIPGLPAAQLAYATVEISGKISGPPGVLTPGFHGMHIHESAIGGCVPPFTSTLGHFDPGPSSNSNVDANHPFHAGDVFPNLVVDANGIGIVKASTSRITLSPGPLSVFDPDGSAVIVHLNPDRGLTGVAGASGGPRIACGVIEYLPNDIVVDEFTAPPLSPTKWTSAGQVAVASGQAQLSTQSGGCPDDSSITSVSSATLGSRTLTMEFIAQAYAEGPTGSTLYGNRQPRGLAAGTDRNNAIEFISEPNNSVRARTVSGGTATETVINIGHTVYVMTTYRIEATSSEVRFYVDGVLGATHTTNIPTTALNAHFRTTDGCAGNVPLYTERVSIQQ